MAIILDDCGYAIPEFMNTTRCANCSRVFREDESEWASLCQECGEDDEADNSVFGRSADDDD